MKMMVSPCLPMDSAVYLCCFTAACCCCVQVCIALRWTGLGRRDWPALCHHFIAEAGPHPSTCHPTLYYSTFHSAYCASVFTRTIWASFSLGLWRSWSQHKYPQMHESAQKVPSKCQFVPESTANKACVTFQLLTAQRSTLSTAAAQFSEVGIGRGHWWWG